LGLESINVLTSRRFGIKLKIHQENGTLVLLNQCLSAIIYSEVLQPSRMYKIETNISAVDSLDLVGEVRWMIFDENNDFVDGFYFNVIFK
jgi:hypothetical protein